MEGVTMEEEVEVCRIQCVRCGSAAVEGMSTTVTPSDCLDIIRVNAWCRACGNGMAVRLLLDKQHTLGITVEVGE